MKTEYALITGASGGIGYDFATIFAKNGYNLILVARSHNKLIEIANTLNNNYEVTVKVIAKDLSDINNCVILYEEIQAMQLNISFLINNAGFGEYGWFNETLWDKELQMINLNIAALTYLSKMYYKNMIKQGFGRILNVASTAAFQPGPLMAVYFASKAYVLSFSEALANEAQGTGITVTALCPGPTQTGFIDTANATDTKMFKNLQVAKSYKVAQFGYNALMKGKTVAIYGILNKIIVASIRFTPRKLVAAGVRLFTNK